MNIKKIKNILDIKNVLEGKTDLFYLKNVCLIYCANFSQQRDTPLQYFYEVFFFLLLGNLKLYTFIVKIF